MQNYFGVKCQRANTASNYKYVIISDSLQVSTELCSPGAVSMVTTRPVAPMKQDVSWQSTLHYCQLVADAHVRQLHSVDTRTLVVSRTRSSFGDRTFAATGPTSLEQSAAQSQTMWAVIRPVQAVTEDIFIRTVRPRRSVFLSFNCAK